LRRVPDAGASSSRQEAGWCVNARGERARRTSSHAPPSPSADPGAAATHRYAASISEGTADDELVAAAQAGGREALEDLLRRHHDRIYAVCRRLTGNDADAADATQESLMAVVRGLPRFDRRSRFSTWAYRVAVNASLDELRRRRRRPEPGLQDDLHGDRTGLGGGSSGPGGMATIEPGGMASPRPGGVTAPTGADPEAVAERLDVDAALRRLPPDFRAAVVLRDLCGLDYAEIGEVLGVPPGTVRSRIARGRAALVPLLKECGPHHGNQDGAIKRPSSKP
jgi:RNA polymerase sigma-70 factor, ECF subfamily